MIRSGRALSLQCGLLEEQVLCCFFFFPVGTFCFISVL